ncbi:MAG: hypothetical protein AAGF10_03285 [Verrucomicrobiota bacterium]
MRKRRSDSTLGKLPEATRNAIFSLEKDEGLSLNDMVVRLAMPVDEGGFGIKTSCSALQRFLRDMRTQAFISELAAGRDRIEQTAKALEATDEVDYDPILMESLKEFTLDLLASREVDPEAISFLFKELTAAKRVELQETKLAQDERKLVILEKKAAAFDKAKDVADDSNLSPEEKLEAIRKGLKI